MLRRFIPALTLVACAFAFSLSPADADTFNARITKVDGNKVTWAKGKFDKDAGKFIIDEKSITTSTVESDAVIENAGTAKKKVKADATPVDGGLKNEVFSKIDTDKGGLNASLTTKEDGGKGNITKISLKKGGGKKGA